MPNGAEMNRETQVVEHNKELIRKFMTELGFTHVDQLADLELTPKQIKQIEYAKPEREGVAFYAKERPDGEKVTALIRAMAGRYIAADVFSPAFHGGHTMNNDFHEIELKQLLTDAMRPARTP